jgi:hypothetical protein
MDTATPERERFQHNDIPTRLNYLAVHLDQMRYSVGVAIANASFNWYGLG